LLINSFSCASVSVGSRGAANSELTATTKLEVVGMRNIKGALEEERDGTTWRGREDN
jgi:hypothetical protein